MRGERGLAARLGATAWRLLPAWALAVLIDAVVLPLVGLPWLPLRSLVVSGAALLVLTLGAWTLRQLLVSMVLLLLGGLAMLWSRDQVIPFLETLGRGLGAALEGEEWLSQNPGAVNRAFLVQHQRLLGDLLRIGIALPCWILAARFPRPLLTLFFSLVVISGAAYYNQSGLLGPAFGLLVVVVWLSVAAQRSRAADLAATRMLRLGRESLVVGLLAIALALVPALAIQRLVSPADLYNAGAHAFVDDLTYLLPENWIAPYHFRLFTIRDAGYYPYGTRLGGSVTLNDRPVFDIEGETAGLLRGQSSRIYTGQSWQADREQISFRFENPMFRDRRDAIWPPWTTGPAAEALGSDVELVRQLDYRVTLRSDRLQTYMIGGRATAIELHANQPYLTFIDESGTINATRAFNPGQAYEVTSENLDFGRWFARAAGRTGQLPYAPDAIDTTARQGEWANYLQLPDSAPYRPGGSVYEAAVAVGIRGATSLRLNPETPGQPITSGERGAGAIPQDRLSRVLRLRNWLQSMQYSLEVVDVPEGQDFVEHVLTTQRGYCVYYASALAVMARSLGIPARYVEGFAIGGEREGSVRLANEMTVTNRSAHAWTEVYLDEIGWIPVDGTPGEGLSDTLPEPPIATPTPTPTPEPTQTTEPSAPPPPETTPPVQPPSFEPTQPTAPLPTQPPPSLGDRIARRLPQVFLGLVILALLYLLIQRLLRWRVRRWTRLLHPARMREALPTMAPAGLILLYWDAILMLLREVGLRSLPDDQRLALRRRGLSLREEVRVLSEAPTVREGERLREDLMAQLRLAEEALYGSLQDLPGLERAAVEADGTASSALHTQLYQLASLTERLMDRFTRQRGDRALRRYCIRHSYGRQRLGSGMGQLLRGWGRALRRRLARLRGGGGGGKGARED